MVAQQKQRTEKIHKETERIKAVADAERLKEIQAIDIQKKIQMEEGKSNVSSINNEMMAKKRVNAFLENFKVASIAVLIIKFCNNHSLHLKTML